MDHQNIRRRIKRIMSYFRLHKKRAKIIAIISICIGIYFTGIAKQGNAVLTGTILNVSHNPFKIIYYGTIYQGAIVMTFVIGLALFAIINYISIVLFLKDEVYDDRNFIISDSGVYGTSRFMPEEEKDRLLNFDKKVEDVKENIVGIEKETKRYISVKPDDEMPIGYSLNKNKFISGGSGQRKTRSQVIPDILQYIERGESYFSLDPKGEVCAETYKVAEKNGYNCKILNLVNPLNSDGIDLLKLVGKSTLMAQTFASILMANANGESGGATKKDFWDSGELALVAFGILYVSMSDEYKPEDKKLHKVYEFLIKTPFEDMESKAEALGPMHPAKKQWDIFMTTEEKQRAGFMTGLATKLQLLNEPSIQNITSRDEMDLVAPGKEKCAYYIIVSDQDDSLNLIAAVVFSLAFILQVKYADKRYTRKVKIPINYVLDEFPNVGIIPNIQQKMNTLRSRDINVTVITQGLGRLMDKYPGHAWEDIITACDTNVFLGISEHETNASWWSDKTGTMTVEVDSSKEKSNVLDVLHLNSNVDQTKGKGKRNVMMPDELTTMDKKYALVFFTGYHVLQVEKFDYSAHPLCKEMEDYNPAQHTPKWWDDVKSEPWFQQELSVMQEEWEEYEQEKLEYEIEKAKKKNKKKKSAQHMTESNPMDKGSDIEGMPQSISSFYTKMKDTIKVATPTKENITNPLKNMTEDILGKTIRSLESIQGKVKTPSEAEMKRNTGKEVEPDAQQDEPYEKDLGNMGMANVDENVTDANINQSAQNNIKSERATDVSDKKPVIPSYNEVEDEEDELGADELLDEEDGEVNDFWAKAESMAANMEERDGLDEEEPEEWDVEEDEEYDPFAEAETNIEGLESKMNSNLENEAPTIMRKENPLNKYKVDPQPSKTDKMKNQHNTRGI